MRVGVACRLACVIGAAALLLAGMREIEAGEASPLRRSAPPPEERRLPIPLPDRAYFMQGRAKLTDARSNVGPLLEPLTASFVPESPQVVPSPAERSPYADHRTSVEALGDVAWSVQALQEPQAERVRLAAALRKVPVAGFLPAWRIRLSRERALGAPDLGIQVIDEPLGYLLDEPLQILGDVASTFWDIELGSDSILRVSSRLGPQLGRGLLYVQVASEEHKPLCLSRSAADSVLSPRHDGNGRFHAIFLGFDVGL